mmetsp:Transcript_115923/g.322797  ORF Transcript_115923/g.322797 Transcript_115923/m.322797 type:complete len:220 (-) Transcript_115923:45-704(-)
MVGKLCDEVRCGKARSQSCELGDAPAAEMRLLLPPHDIGGGDEQDHLITLRVPKPCVEVLHQGSETRLHAICKRVRETILLKDAVVSHGANSPAEAGTIKPKRDPPASINGAGAGLLPCGHSVAQNTPSHLRYMRGQIMKGRVHPRDGHRLVLPKCLQYAFSHQLDVLLPLYAFLRLFAPPRLTLAEGAHTILFKLATAPTTSASIAKGGHAAKRRNGT